MQRFYTFVRLINIYSSQLYFISKIMARPKYSHAEMIALGRKIHLFLTADLIDFMAFDASIDSNYLSLFDAAIIAAENHPDDETVVDIQTGFTAAVVDTEKKCRKVYQRLKIFVEKAFPISRAVQNEFGFNDYGNLSNTADLIKFMHKINTTANKYSADLLAVSYTLTDITGLATLHNELVTAVDNQEEYKSERMKLTDEREALLGKLYEFISFIGKIGKIIYEDNRAQYARYLLPSTNNNNIPTQRIGTQAREVVKADVQAADYYTLRVLTNGLPLQFYIAPNGSSSVPSTAITLNPSTSATDFAADELGFDSNYQGAQSLFVYNPNGVEIGYTFDMLS